MSNFPISGAGRLRMLRDRTAESDIDRFDEDLLRPPDFNKIARSAKPENIEEMVEAAD